MFQCKGDSRDENESHCAALNWMLKEGTGYRRALRQLMKSEHRQNAGDGLCKNVAQCYIFCCS